MLNQSHEFPQLLKQWRQNRGLSQLELGHRANVSSRHLSFLETGRSQPSREMVLRLGQVLDLPLRNRNQLLLSAGFASQFSEQGLDESTMAELMAVLRMMLEQHEPYPAVVIDSCWNLLMANRAQQKLLSAFNQQSSTDGQMLNIVQTLLDPQGLKPFIKNWSIVASLLLQRLHRDYAATKNHAIKLLLDKLSDAYAWPERWDQAFEHEHPVYIEVQLRWGAHELRLLNTISSLGAATDVTAQELRIEQFFPLDESTKAFFQQLARE